MDRDDFEKNIVPLFKGILRASVQMGIFPQSVLLLRYKLGMNFPLSKQKSNPYFIRVQIKFFVSSPRKKHEILAPKESGFISLMSQLQLPTNFNVPLS